jgi:hypothetical protein
MGVGLLGCGGDARVHRCTDSLAGQWAADDSSKAPSGEVRAYDVIEHDNGRLEVHVMFDDSVPPDGTDKLATDVIYAPSSFALARVEGGLAGERIQRRTKNGKMCIVKLAAKATCGAGRVELSWQTAASVDWTDCKVVAADAWTSVSLKR